MAGRGSENMPLRTSFAASMMRWTRNRVVVEPEIGSAVWGDVGGNRVMAVGNPRDTRDLTTERCAASKSVERLDYVIILSLSKYYADTSTGIAPRLHTCLCRMKP